MKHIKETDGIDFVIKSRPQTIKDRKIMSEIIPHY
jgi:hypothetical protein